MMRTTTTDNDMIARRGNVPNKSLLYLRFHMEIWVIFSKSPVHFYLTAGARKAVLPWLPDAGVRVYPRVFMEKLIMVEFSLLKQHKGPKCTCKTYAGT